MQEKVKEAERVKFLQEAAIMGQFHHPNVIALHGVVTVGEPVNKTQLLLMFTTNQLCQSYLSPIVDDCAGVDGKRRSQAASTLPQTCVCVALLLYSLASSQLYTIIVMLCLFQMKP